MIILKSTLSLEVVLIRNFNYNLTVIFLPLFYFWQKMRFGITQNDSYTRMYLGHNGGHKLKLKRLLLWPQTLSTRQIFKFTNVITFITENHLIIRKMSC